MMEIIVDVLVFSAPLLVFWNSLSAPKRNVGKKFAFRTLMINLAIIFIYWPLLWLVVNQLSERVGFVMILFQGLLWVPTFIVVIIFYLMHMKKEKNNLAM